MPRSKWTKNSDFFAFKAYITLPTFWAKLGYSQIKIGVHLLKVELSQLLTLVQNYSYTFLNLTHLYKPQWIWMRFCIHATQSRIIWRDREKKRCWKFIQIILNKINKQKPKNNQSKVKKAVKELFQYHLFECSNDKWFYCNSKLILS